MEEWRAAPLNNEAQPSEQRVSSNLLEKWRERSLEDTIKRIWKAREMEYTESIIKYRRDKPAGSLHSSLLRNELGPPSAVSERELHEERTVQVPDSEAWSQRY